MALAGKSAIEKKDCLGNGADDSRLSRAWNAWSVASPSENTRCHLEALTEKPASDRPLLPRHLRKKYRYRVTRLGMPYAVSVGILQYVQLSGQGVLRFEADPRGHPERTDYLRSWNDSYEGQRSSYKMHPGNRVLIVFQDDHTIGRFQKDHPHCASWDAENRRKAAEKPRPRPQKRKE